MKKADIARLIPVKTTANEHSRCNDKVGSKQRSEA